MALMWLDHEEKGLLFEIKSLLSEFTNGRKALKDEIGLSAEVVRLKKRITELEIQESKIKEAHEKEDRELRHMIGLEKKRQEFEIDQAKRDTTVKVREENLEADKKRFTENMAFIEKRFTEEVRYLKEIMGTIMERLPNVNVEKKR